ncbi:redox-sensitive transcriptional activator SoxR [Kytococcus sedentarius]|uniref:Transcriptional regulator, MerR family n=1 Tax=Kytococcus sedentarius (strain ATCC 14392 / DSM 20547 / JCM 11482 / CCUG 33030 / NBRC 15357 / NCTC 11040 / CCM 314 / 541) TaxID=478801 RepID=C7NJ41_KYTSD|nr:redox-sensitive transcriptional activator SoxR [Kytococcus sedentarius]ACV05266.1 transcriptional regulator, MerR family [Kytococcus sedentarius DSM 20547]STX13327.1 Redox-sensitive transcriptional activator soxR [Kytococcus sedentarius]
MITPHDELTMSEVVRRSGVSASALRFYEARGLIKAERTATNRRIYQRHVLRRLAVIRSAQAIGLSLSEIRAGFASVPTDRALTREEWQDLSAMWRETLEERIAALGELRDRLDGCIACGCLSLDTCPLRNPEDERRAEGPGPRAMPAVLALMNGTSAD